MTIPYYIAQALLWLIKILYAVSVISLTLVGLNNLIIVITYLFNKKKAWSQKTPPAPVEWPRVTVQLPIYNERYLGERVIRAAAALDYPRDRLEIQVLDDSNDFTSELLQKVVEELRGKGVDVNYLHRPDRKGYKAGNLTYGMQFAKGEFFAIFDADFVPPADWLKKTVPWFCNEKLGFIQTRWEHMNFNKNLVTRMAGVMMDAHFIIEENARSTTGLITGFTGSAGIWRRKTLDSAGGWQWDTMTEDIDMTFRSQLAGWKGMFLPEVTAPAELPESMNEFKLQQYRWCRGGAQVAFKLMGKTIAAKHVSLRVKVMGLLHLLSFLTMPLLILMLLLVLPVALQSPGFLLLFWWGSIAAVGPLLLFALPETEHAPRLIDRLKVVPFLALFGVGISMVCGLSVVSGATQKGGVFLRTARVDPRIGGDPDVRRKRLLRLFITGEIAMAAYLVASVFAISRTFGWVLAPWLFSSSVGYLFNAAYSIMEQRVQLQA